MFKGLNFILLRLMASYVPANLDLQAIGVM